MTKKTFYTATQAACQLGCSVATISRWAARLGLDSRHGSAMMLTQDHVFEIDKHRHKQSGNPAFTRKNTG